MNPTAELTISLNPRAFCVNKEVYCPRGGNDIKLKGDDKLFISGYEADQNNESFDLYYINIADNEKTFLLPSYKKYGLKFSKEFPKNFDTSAIGINVWFDIQGNDVYFVWEGDLKIIKIDIKSQEMTAFVSIFRLFLFPFISKFGGISSHWRFYPNSRRKK